MTETKTSKEEKLFLMLKLDRSKRRWRLFAIILFIIVLILGSAGSNQQLAEIPEQNYIAEIKIEGMILENDYRLKRLEQLKEDKNAKAVILVIDSPGGSMVPGLEILDYLKDIAKEKPLVVQMKTVAASAGFMISLAGEHVVANRASLTGSVGVLMPLVDATELSDKLGIKSAEITSGDLKSITSPFNPRTEKGQVYLQSTVNELQQIFMEEVKASREISPEVESIITDGRLLIGQKAYEYGLIDGIGRKKDLLEYLHNTKKLSKELPVLEFSLEEPKKLNLQNILTEELTSKIDGKLENILWNVDVL